jgi:hypothetical protein
MGSDMDERRLRDLINQAEQNTICSIATCSPSPNCSRRARHSRPTALRRCIPCRRNRATGLISSPIRRYRRTSKATDHPNRCRWCSLSMVAPGSATATAIAATTARRPRLCRPFGQLSRLDRFRLVHRRHVHAGAFLLQRAGRRHHEPADHARVHAAYWAGFAEFMYRSYGNPRTPEGRALLAERSPIHKIDRIKKPMLIFHGANDVRCKVVESDTIVAAMQAKDIPVTYVSTRTKGTVSKSPPTGCRTSPSRRRPSRASSAARAALAGFRTATASLA